MQIQSKKEFRYKNRNSFFCKSIFSKSVIPNSDQKLRYIKYCFVFLYKQYFLSNFYSNTSVSVLMPQLSVLVIIACYAPFLHHLLQKMLHLFYNSTPLDFTFVKKYLRKSFLRMIPIFEHAKRHFW